MMKLPGNYWENIVSIIPVVKMDTRRGLWVGVCNHPDHDVPWQTEMNNAGGAAVALEQHWRAWHD